MKDTFYSGKVWGNIKKAAQNCNRASYVAVAYLGQGGADLLPLRKGSMIVVDASESTVKSGQTHPNDLLKLYRKGVRIYSHPKLHAKVYVFGTKLLIGSANVSKKSARYLDEAIMATGNRASVNKAITFVESLCTPESELGYKELKILQTKYRPPEFENGKNVNGGGTASKKNTRKLYIAKLHSTNYSPGYEEPLKKGQQVAEQRKSNNRRHMVDKFEWVGKVQVKDNDMIIQVSTEGGKVLVSPPARVLNIEPWDDDKRALVFLEVLNKRRKTLAVVNQRLGEKILERNGYRNYSYVNKVGELWQ